jgi:hypothetical protein
MPASSALVVPAPASGPVGAARLSSLLLAAMLGACSSEPTAPDFDLTLRGLAGEERILHRADLAGLPAIEGYGGMLNTVGRVTPPARYGGVRLADLAAIVGGLGDDAALSITASDDYGVTLSRSQVGGEGVVAFDPASGDPVTLAEPLEAALASSLEGRLLAADNGGPLRSGFLSVEAEQVTEGHLWVRSVVRVEVVAAEPEWSLRLVGARTDEISRTLFESGAAPGCHEASWTDGDGRVWTGMPLWLLVGWVDDQNVHLPGSFNRELAAAGYPVEVVSITGERRSFTSDQIALDNGFVVANEVDGEPLDEAAGPLRLVGSSLAPGEDLAQVEQIDVVVP